MAVNWYPIINEEACIECGACIDHCKKGVYDKTQTKATVVEPDNCSFRCECCKDLCPVDAITYYQEPTLFKITKKKH